MNTFKPVFILGALGLALVVVYTTLSRSPETDRDPAPIAGIDVPSTDAPLVQMPGAASSTSPFGAAPGAASAAPSFSMAPESPIGSTSYPSASPYPSSATDPPGSPYGPAANVVAPSGYESAAPAYGGGPAPSASAYPDAPAYSSAPAYPANGSPASAGRTQGISESPLPAVALRDDSTPPGNDAPAWPSSQSAAGLAPQPGGPGADPIGDAPPYAGPNESAAAPATRTPQGPMRPDADIEQSFQQLMDQVSRELDAGKLAEAHLALSQFYRNPGLSPQQRQQIVQLLDQLAGTVIYSPQSLLEEPYVVRPGDTLQTIADQHQVPPELIANINGIRDPRGVRPGQELKVVRGPFHAIVHLDDYELTMMLGGRYAGRFPITIGPDQPNLEGSYIVTGKGVSPTYYGPDGTTFDERDQRNPLGSLWLGLGDRIGQSTSLGIHGTNDPGNIGRNAPRGSIGLDRRDIEDVYGILSVGSRVVVQR